mgnify:CR=1 FL=1
MAVSDGLESLALFVDAFVTPMDNQQAQDGAFFLRIRCAGRLLV